MISAGVEGRLPYMTYPEPWRGPPKQPPEFLRPAPKPLLSTRYNGLTNPSPNGSRLANPPRPQSKYSPPAVAPVNLTQHKEEITDDLSYSYSRLFQTPPYSCCHPNPYQNIFHQSPYTSILRPNFVPAPPSSPLETYLPTTCSASSNNSGTFLSPSTTYSPPSSGGKSNQSLLRDRTASTSFKIPSGKEGSLKHRILIRPEDPSQRNLLDQQKSVVETHGIPESCAKRLTATPPDSPTKTLNNNAVPANFKKGSLIQLTNGELRKVEDIRTEDFVSSAENSQELRLADSTVVKIEENPIIGTVTITLTYNHRRTQTDVEYPLEHPFFVYGKGWASCNAERTFQCFRLKVHHLQVGDIIISLTPRTSSQSATIVTTATTIAMTVRQLSTMGHQSAGEASQNERVRFSPNHSQLASRHNVSSYNHQASRGNNKRRWSAPDQICDEDEHSLKKVKME